MFGLYISFGVVDYLLYIWRTTTSVQLLALCGCVGLHLHLRYFLCFTWYLDCRVCLVVVGVCALNNFVCSLYTFRFRAYRYLVVIAIFEGWYE